MMKPDNHPLGKGKSAKSVSGFHGAKESISIWMCFAASLSGNLRPPLEGASTAT